jgi:NAD(P)-dependent dehydrogenase (short-subunit alcohol dehydrogenase family)
MNVDAKHSKSVLITGCSSGFGKSMVTAFLEDGWTVFATLRRATERCEIFREDQKRFGVHLVILECDVASRSDREDVRQTLERSGLGLDCLINNAGQMFLGPLEDTREKQLREQMETNFFGATLLIQEVLPLLRQRRGTIINVSSVFGFTTWPLTSIYCASKYALEGLTQSLRQELEPHGVRVVLLEPGSHPTALMRNLHWGDRFTLDQSVYRSQTEGYRAFRSALAERMQKDNSDVAGAAVRLARSKTPRLRNPVGLETRVLSLAVRICPEIVGVKLMAWLAQRTWRKALKTSGDVAKPLARS